MISLKSFFAESIGSWLLHVCARICITLDQLVYDIVKACYDLFEIACTINIFNSDPSSATFELYDGFTKRVYSVLCVAMIFILAYFLIMKIINPDGEARGFDSRKFVPDLLITIIGIALMPTVFDYMQLFQEHVIQDNTIGQIVLGTGLPAHQQAGAATAVTLYSSFVYPEGKEAALIDLTYTFTCNEELANRSRVCSGDVDAEETKCKPASFKSFRKGHKSAIFSFLYINGSCTIHVDEEWQATFPFLDVKVPTFFNAIDFLNLWHDDDGFDYTVPEGFQFVTNKDPMPEECNDHRCLYYAQVMSFWYNTGSPSTLKHDAFIDYIGRSDGIHYTWILVTVAGIWAAWCFIAYAFEMGRRAFKLAFLQIVTPVFFGLRLLPVGKQSYFPRWSKELTKVYLQVFIQMFFMYFTVFLISLIPKIVAAFFQTEAANERGYGFFARMWIVIILIIGLLNFLKEAPEWIRNLFPTDGLNLKGINLSPRKSLKTTVAPVVNMAAGGIAGGVAAFKNRKMLAQANGFTGRGAGLRNGLSTTRQMLRGMRRGGLEGYNNGNGLGPRSISNTINNSMVHEQADMNNQITRRAEHRRRREELRDRGHYAAYYGGPLARAFGLEDLRRTYESLGEGRGNVQVIYNTTNNIETHGKDANAFLDEAQKPYRDRGAAHKNAIRDGSAPISVVQQMLDGSNAEERANDELIMNDTAIQSMRSEGRTLFLGSSGAVYSSEDAYVDGEAQAAGYTRGSAAYEAYTNSLRGTASANSGTVDQIMARREAQLTSGGTDAATAKSQAYLEAAQIRKKEYQTSAGSREAAIDLARYHAGDMKDRIDRVTERDAIKASAEARFSGGAYTAKGEQARKQYEQMAKDWNEGHINPADLEPKTRKEYMDLESDARSSGIAGVGSIGDVYSIMGDASRYSSLTDDERITLEGLATRSRKLNTHMNADASIHGRTFEAASSGGSDGGGGEGQRPVGGRA